jgi:predicted Zn-dependent peptidase
MFELNVMKNGLSVVTSPMPHARSVTIAALIKTGSRYETQSNSGVSHLLEHMVFKGTRKFPDPRMISEGIEKVGGGMNASTDRELTIYWCKVPSEYFSQALEIIGDMLLAPLFVPAELDKERFVVLEEIHMSLDDPASKAELLLEELLWGQHPMGRHIAGTEESLNQIEINHLSDYWRSQYSPSNMVLSIAGDIDSTRVVSEIEQLFGDWIPVNALSFPAFVSNQTAPQILLETKKTQQTQVCMAFHGVSVVDDQRNAVNLLDTILGDGMSSRLFVELRENKALTYDIHSYSNQMADCGSFHINSGVDSRRLQDALVGITDELRGIKSNLTEDELGKAKTLLKGRMDLRLEDSRNVALWLGGQQATYGFLESPEQVLEDIMRVSLDEVMLVAQDMFRSQNLNLTILGPHRSIERVASSISL